jgi:hypothetical protein
LLLRSLTTPFSLGDNLGSLTTDILVIESAPTWTFPPLNSISSSHKNTMFEWKAVRRFEIGVWSGYLRGYPGAMGWDSGKSLIPNCKTCCFVVDDTFVGPLFRICSSNKSTLVA